MPITTCTVSGNVQDLLGQDVSGVTISVSSIKPFFHSGTMISGQIAQTSTDANGDWSLAVVETETLGLRLSFTFEYSNGNSGKKKQSYAVIVPDDATANFSSLISASTGPATISTFPAELVSVVPTGNLVATNAQTALVELQTDIDAINTLADGKIYMGNASNAATEVTVSGDITLSNAGVAAISSGVIVNADVNASAAIDVSKLAALTASRAVQSDASGLLTHSAVTSTELGYVSGVTSAIQTQLNAKQSTTLADGNILVGNVSNVATSVTPTGDVTISNAGVTAIASGVIVNDDINASAAIDRSKMANGTADHVVINSGAGALSSEAQLATSRGGTGQNLSASTGALSVASGTVSAGILTTANGGTGQNLSAASGAISVSAGTVSAGTLSVGNGGTGATSLTANNVLLGNGTSAIQVVAPGTSGNVLTSNGTTWQSTTPSGGTAVGAVYKTNAGQVIADNTTSIIDFEDSVYDTNSAVTTGASWKFTAPSTGKYHVSCSIKFQQGNFGGANVKLMLYKNNSLYLYIGGFDPPNASLHNYVRGMCDVELAATDYIDVRVLQNSTVNMTLDTTAEYNHIDIHKIGN